MGATYYTIGMAGHIDHGKTSLTKALTGIDTDRLKEEKERNISIEPGYAPLQTKDGVKVSIVDVPGHERFIRQMIAGVAGIDLVLLVIAADEGVMPQTKEHLNILEFLGIQRCIVVVTKIDRVDDELLEIVTEDIKEELADTSFNHAPFLYVDSLSKKGLTELKEAISHELDYVKNRDERGSFRLPIDQVFTVQGHGTIVRGTIYEGKVKKGNQLIVLPEGKKVKARQIQVHNLETEEARAGQRTAINIGGINKQEIQRGDVLVDSTHFLVTKTIDVALRFVHDLSSPIKQRSPIKLHIGTSEIMGKIVFFDRNDVHEDAGEVLCQIRLDDELVVRRGDRFILRRPTPVETLGGGWVIQPKGGKYRYGPETINMLNKQKEGSPEDIVKDVLTKHKLLNLQDLAQYTSLDQPEVKAIIGEGLTNETYFEVHGNKYGLITELLTLKDEVLEQLKAYHQKYPMRPGLRKAELIQTLAESYPKDFVELGLNLLIEKEAVTKEEQFVFEPGFNVHLPNNWKKRMEQIIHHLENDGVAPKKWDEYIKTTPISKDDGAELSAYLVYTKQALWLTDDMLIHHTAFDKAVAILREQTGEQFELTEAKDILNVSRKYLIPFLELLDSLKLTVRLDGERKWRAK